MIKVACKPHSFKLKIGVIWLDEDPWREMAASLLKGRELDGSYVSMEAWEEAWDLWERRHLKVAAYDRLSRRRYFTSELKKALLTLGFSLDKITSTLNELEQLGYLNDQEGVESLTSSGIRKKKGPGWIRNKLYEKGGDVTFDAESAYPKEQREAVIRELLIKNQKKGGKAIASVARKGFSLDEIISIYHSMNFNS